MAVTKGHGNPRWTRDETILALDLYLRCANSMPGPNDPRVIELSNVLRSLPIYPAGLRQESFRNPEGVAFKLQNLRQVATGRGLANVSTIDKEVWADYSGSPEQVSSLAREIRVEASAEAVETPAEEEDFEFAEGRLLTRAHRRRERNAKVRTKLISYRLRQSGGLTCDACGAGPRVLDAEISDAGFEAHHTAPLAQSSEEGTSTRLADMALLCAVCHRLLHRLMQRRRTWMSIATFKAYLAASDRGIK